MKTDSRQVFGDILCNIVGFINCQSKGGYYFLCCTIFLNVLKNKDQLLSPDDNSRFAILCKRTTVERRVSRASESEVQPSLVCRVLLASKMKTSQSPT